MTLPAYTVTRKRMKHVRIRVSPPDGRVTVSAPRHVSEADIAKFVAEKAEWIAKHQERIALLPPPLDERELEELRAHLKAEIPAYLDYWVERIGVPRPSFGVRRMTTRWGTCNPQRVHITIALELARRDPELLEYVIVHELAHLIERGHGPRFQAVLDEHLPDWRVKRRILNGTT